MKDKITDALARQAHPKISKEMREILQSPLRRDSSNLGLMRQILLFSKWDSLRGHIGYTNKPKLTESEIYSIPIPKMADYLNIVLDLTPRRIDLIFQPRKGVKSDILEMNEVRNVLKRNIENLRSKTDSSIPQEERTTQMVQEMEGFTMSKSSKKRRRRRQKLAEKKKREESGGGGGDLESVSRAIDF